MPGKGQGASRPAPPLTPPTAPSATAGAATAAAATSVRRGLCIQSLRMPRSRRCSAMAGDSAARTSPSALRMASATAVTTAGDAGGSVNVLDTSEEVPAGMAEPSVSAHTLGTCPAASSCTPYTLGRLARSPAPSVTPPPRQGGTTPPVALAVPQGRAASAPAADVSSSTHAGTSPSPRGCATPSGNATAVAAAPLTPFTTVSLYDTAPNAQSLMEVIHARQTRAAQHPAPEVSARFAGTPQALSDTALDDSSSLLPSVLQCSSSSPPASVYRDMYRAPELMSADGTASVPRRGPAPITRRCSSSVVTDGAALSSATCPSAHPEVSQATAGAVSPRSDEVGDEGAASHGGGGGGATVTLEASAASLFHGASLLTLNAHAPLIPYSAELPCCGALRSVSPHASSKATAAPASASAPDAARTDGGGGGGGGDDDALDAAAAAAAVDAIGLQPVLADTMPYGRRLLLNLLTTWGDPYEVGLGAVELFDETGARVLPRPCAASAVRQTAKVRDGMVSLAATSPDGQVRAFAEYAETEAHADAASAGAAEDGGEEAADPRRQLRALLCPHSLNTHDEREMFAVPYTAGEPHVVTLAFARPVRLSVMRLHNYAGKGRVHATKGAHIMEAFMDDVLVFRGEVQMHTGELCRVSSDEDEPGEDGEADDGEVAPQKGGSAGRGRLGGASAAAATASSAYGLRNCENVLWCTDAAVLDRVMAHAPPPVVSSTSLRRDTKGAGRPASSGARAEATPRLRHHPTFPRRPQTGVVRYAFSSTRHADVGVVGAIAAAPAEVADPQRPSTSDTPTHERRRPHDATAAGGGTAATAVEAWTSTAGVSPLRHARQRSRQAVLDPLRCPRHIVAVSLMLLSTWGTTQHVGLSGLRLRDAAGDVLRDVTLRCVAMYYPDGTTSVWPSDMKSGGDVWVGPAGEAQSENSDAAAAAAELAGLSVRHLLHQSAPPHVDGGKDGHAAHDDDDDDEALPRPCRLPFQPGMQLVFVLATPAPTLGFIDVANFSVGDQTSCGVKEARVFFAEAQGAGEPRSVLPDVFRELWSVCHAPSSRQAVASARVFEVTPPVGVTLRKAPALLEEARFQSYDVSLYGTQQVTDTTVEDGGGGGPAAAAAAPSLVSGKHLGNYEIALGPGTGGSAEADLSSLGLGGGGGGSSSRRGWRAVSLSLSGSLGASVTIRATVAMQRARVAATCETPEWLLTYQPYVTPQLPLGYVCRVRLHVCARDVPATAAQPPGSMISAAASLKAFMKLWMLKPLRACSFVNEHGDVVKPVRPDKHRAELRQRAGVEDEDVDGAQAERIRARRVPMVTEALVSIAPAAAPNPSQAMLSPPASAATSTSPPLQVVLELLYVADVPFCTSLLALHAPLVVPGSAAWVRQLQVFMDDTIIFSSGEAAVRLAKETASDVQTTAATSSEATAAPNRSPLHGCDSDAKPAGTTAAAAAAAPLWADLPACTTSLRPFVIFTLDPDLLNDVRASSG